MIDLEQFGVRTSRITWASRSFSLHTSALQEQVGIEDRFQFLE